MRNFRYTETIIRNFALVLEILVAPPANLRFETSQKTTGGIILTDRKRL